MFPFSHWNSHGPLCWGKKRQGFHLLSSTDLTAGLSLINPLIWEGGTLPLLRGEQSLSPCILVPGCSRDFLPGTPASGARGSDAAALPAGLPSW